jgi:hypothetical protein
MKKAFDYITMGVLNDKDGNLSISRCFKFSAFILFLWAGVKFLNVSPEAATLTFGAVVLGHPLTSAGATFINSKSTKAGQDE